MALSTYYHFKKINIFCQINGYRQSKILSTALQHNFISFEISVAFPPASKFTKPVRSA